MAINTSIRCFSVICVVTWCVSVANGLPRASCTDLSNLTFPSEFLFGAGTSAYQIEGNDGFKGTSWLDYTFQSGAVTPDESNGDIACDSYNKYEDDIAIANELKLNHYSFSIAWSRILRTGFLNGINQEGVDYYNSLINKLLEAGIEPWVTMYHFDLPQTINHLGGWDNPTVIDYFTSYADLLFSLFGDRVKTWLTINEPITFCVDFPTQLARFDGTEPFGITEYTCTQNALIAHAKIYRLYGMKYKAIQKGRIAIVLGGSFPIPASTSTADVEAAERARSFEYGLYLHPLVYGNYPRIVMNTLSSYSKAQGYGASRLPDLRLIEQLEIQGAYDFIAINHYSSRLTTDNRTVNDDPHFENDIGVTYSVDSSWGDSSIPWLKVYPEGFRLFLNWIKDTYGNPEIAVIGQGFPDEGKLNDEERINYYELYLSEALKAIHEDGVRLTAYTARSLMDNFEWFYGYTVKFGLYHVDFESANRTRTPKESVSFFRNVIESRRLFDTCPL